MKRPTHMFAAASTNHRTANTLVAVHVDNAVEPPTRRATPRLAPHRTRPLETIMSVRMQPTLLSSRRPTRPWKHNPEHSRQCVTE